MHIFLNINFVSLFNILFLQIFQIYKFIEILITVVALKNIPYVYTFYNVFLKNQI